MTACDLPSLPRYVRYSASHCSIITKIVQSYRKFNNMHVYEELIVLLVGQDLSKVTAFARTVRVIPYIQIVTSTEN